jgi:hypothetical protein
MASLILLRIRFTEALRGQVGGRDRLRKKPLKKGFLPKNYPNVLI